MAAYIPITLQGSNLKERHRYLNSLVEQAYKENIPINEIINLPERSAIDKIFKIDLASMYKNVDYILQNLKHDDMLFVSRALKCRWLLDTEHRDIICPSHLNNVLYPEMIQPAVNKMKHWLENNLKDAERCEEFYTYYKCNINDAIKFFWHCSNEFILGEFPNVIDKMTPMQMKILFEICPNACKLYFEILPNNRPALTKYVNNEKKYFNCVKYLLKYDSNSFFDIVEKYFNTSKFDPFGPTSTEFIMKSYKVRVLEKIELYASSILHLKTLASHLSSDEAKQIVLQLASAEYLSYWFSYQKVEPIVKRVTMEERVLLKKQVFVEKTIELKVKDWPYLKPTPLNLNDDSVQYLLDVHHDSYEYAYYETCFKRNIMKKKYRGMCGIVSEKDSPLNKLFNRYRFMGFEKTFNELSKKLPAESTIEGRLNMMLVLVSKSGGVSEQVEKLLKFLVEKHMNETNTLRAAVIRSLVKRERVWSVRDQAWNYLLELGRDIGLYGSNAELICREGLHAVIIRHLLNDTSISKDLVAGYLREFSTLSEYKLNIGERAIIAKRLPLQILSSSPIAFLDILREYKVSIKEFPDAVPVLVKVASDDPDLVRRLFDAKMLRRELFYLAFPVKQTNAMCLNALRHDVKPLESGKSFASLVAKQRPNHDRFLLSLSVYFSEPGGLAEQHRTALEDILKNTPKLFLVRPLCILMSSELLLSKLSKICIEKSEDKVQLKIVSEFKSNAHKTRPTFDIDSVDWRWIGAKAVANKVFICRAKDKERFLKKLLEWKKTAKISLRLSSNTHFEVDNFLQVSTLRPSAALDIGFSLHLKRIEIDESVWTSLKSIIENIKDISDKRQLLRKLEDPNSVPKNIEADYWVFVYNIFFKIDKKKAMPMLCHLENLFVHVDRKVITKIVKEFIDTDLCDTFLKDNSLNKTRSLYFRIIAKYLLLCQSEDEQKDVLDNICDKFFDVIEVLFKTEENKPNLLESLDEFICALKYTDAFLLERVTCMTVFERILKRLHKILPVDENFKQYVEIHLTMLFYKSVKQATKTKPNLIEGSKISNEAIKIIGTIFGKYIGNEIKELVLKYFKSIVDIYKKVLIKYLRGYFEFNEARDVFVTYVMKGILESDTTEVLMLAEHIFHEEQYQIAKSHHADIINILKSNNEVKYLLYEDVLRNRNV